MLKPSDIGRFLLGLLIVGVVGVIIVLRVGAHRGTQGRAPVSPPPQPAAVSEACEAGRADARWRGAAEANRASLATLTWSPFGPPETGWATYAPLVAREIGTACPPDSGAFARRYAQWQAQHKRPPDGVFKPEEFDAMRDALALRRPFVRASSAGQCPGAPDEAALAAARPDEGYGGKVVRLRPGALAAYRRMLAAAQQAGVALQGPRMRLVSGFRGPTEEAARCIDGSCNTLTRASCSAHRTGLAIDLYLEPAPGADPISSAEENRRHMAQTPEYRWLVANAAAFGFLPYAYEPWHWEWTGEAP
jgi:D-alanyl-D-alanine carboxypeptidase